MMKVSRRHTAKIKLRAARFHAAVPPCTASILNARMSVPEGRRVYFFCMYYSVFTEVMYNYSAPAKLMQSGSLAPTHERDTDVDGETGQHGRLGVVGEHHSLEADPLLRTRQEAHTGDADVVALLPLLCVGPLIGLAAAMLRLIPDLVEHRIEHLLK